MAETEDPIHKAAKELVLELCAIRSFEVECGCSGEGPLVQLINALGMEIPTSLKEWIKDGDDPDDEEDENQE